MLRKIFVFIIAKISNNFDIFFVKIWVIANNVTTNIARISNDLNLYEDIYILNQIDEYHKA